jgi:hypothetical protein
MTLAQMPGPVVARLLESMPRALDQGQVMHLHQGSGDIQVPAQQVLVSYVLRHSSSGMDVRSTAGHRCRLAPGALLVCHGPGLDMLRTRAQRGGPCHAMDLLLRGGRGPGAFVHLDDYYPTFVNSPHGCIRLLLGTWGGHRAMLDPLDGFWMLDIDVAPGKELTLPAPAAGVIGLLTTGSVEIEGRTVDGAAPLALGRHGDAVSLASDGGASLLLFPAGFA